MRLICALERILRTENNLVLASGGDGVTVMVGEGEAATVGEGDTVTVGDGVWPGVVGVG